MRIGGCIALELSLAAGVCFGTGFVLQRGAAAVAAEVAGTGVGADLAHAELSPRNDIGTAPETEIAGEPAGTFLGMADDVLLDRVRSAEIVKFKVKTGGSSLSFRIDFADGSRAAWKPAQTNLQTVPRKEVAAYRLGRLLGLNAVPPAAPRAVFRDELLTRLDPESEPVIPRIAAETVFDPSGKTLGVASYWIPVIRDSGFDKPEGQALLHDWLTLGHEIPAARRAMAMQLSDLMLFDFLTNNPDRYTGGNMKMSEDGTRLYFMDNTMAFFVQPEGHEVPRAAFMHTQRFSRRLYEALDRLSEDSIRRALAEERGSPFEILTPAEIRSVVARRDFAKRHIDNLIAANGARQILVFP